MIDVFYKTIHHFFPKLSVWLNSIDDPRVKKNYIQHRPPSMDRDIFVSCKAGFKKANKVSTVYR